MIKLTRRIYDEDADCFIDPSEVVMIVVQIDGLTQVGLRRGDYIDSIAQTPAQVVALIEESRR